jgi:hypothetical protein
LTNCITGRETSNTDYFKGLKNWKKITSDLMTTSYLVYGGNEHLVSEGISVVPWDKTAEFITAKAV